jgi:hypothetical protein
MTTGDESAIEQFFYRSVSSSNRHRNRVSAYFVQRFEGSTVVARIESLGLVHTTIGEEQLAIQRLRRNLVVAGTWQPTASRHHARLRVAPATVAMQKVAPQSS